ncbi:MAG: FAD-dependent oxidoreductase [Phycisphaerales bacterium JB039]
MSLPRPTLGDDDVLRVVAGLRPCRRGGLRLEPERLEAGGALKAVVHNYGHGGCGVTIAPGCAQLAADLAEEAAGEGPIAIAGAGVAGLTTALELLQRGRRVVIYAERAGGATTSALAGALWLPTGIEFGSTEAEVARFRDIIARSKRAFASMDRARWGVERLAVYEPEGAPPADEFVAIGAIDQPRRLDRLPLAGPARSGRVYETDFIHTPRYLSVLRAEVERLGGRMVERRFERPAEIAGLAEPVVVNCLGMAAGLLFGDEAMYPARGVLVHLRPQRLGYCVHDGYSYLFPREDALILGGTFEPGQWDLEPVEQIAAAILAHHRRFFGEEA